MSGARSGPATDRANGSRAALPAIIGCAFAAGVVVMALLSPTSPIEEAGLAAITGTLVAMTVFWRVPSWDAPPRARRVLGAMFGGLLVVVTVVWILLHVA